MTDQLGGFCQRASPVRAEFVLFGWAPDHPLADGYREHHPSQGALALI